MKLEDQVCSLEFAKKLKEVGIEQNSLFYWIKESDPYIWFNSNNYPIHTEKFYYSAFTASELGEVLKKHPKICGIYLECIGLTNFTFFCADETIIKFDNEANCRAAYILHLLGDK